MNIDTIRIFCDVVLHQSFSRGALVNEVSQSAATQSIHRLERHLGVQLVDRSRRPFILTPEGQICYDGFRGILESYDTVISMVQTLNDKESGNIRVGAIYSAGLHDMDQVMRNFIKTYPKAKVNLELMHSDRIYQSVLTAEIDFGVVSYPMASSEITVIPLGAEKMVFVCKPGHELAAHKSISLINCITTILSPTRATRWCARRSTGTFASGWSRSTSRAEYENVETIKQAIEVGLGCAILPANTVRTEVKLGTLVSIPITSPKIVQPLGIVHKQGKVFTPAMSKFISLMTEYKWDSVAEGEN